jgi:hypothetical protein
LIDHDYDERGKAVIVDLHGGDFDNEDALKEFMEIKDTVMREVMPESRNDLSWMLTLPLPQRESADRSYRAMWEKYQARVLLAMSAQAFAQLVNVVHLPERIF